jgi:hypothetical protein
MDCFASLAMTEGMAHSRDPVAPNNGVEANPDLIAPQLCGLCQGSKWPEIRVLAAFGVSRPCIFAPDPVSLSFFPRPPDSLS